jgi:hypothetical protein
VAFITVCFAYCLVEQDTTSINQLELLQSLLMVEYQRAQATPSLRLLDEVLDMLGGCALCMAVSMPCACLNSVTRHLSCKHVQYG